MRATTRVSISIRSISYKSRVDERGVGSSIFTCGSMVRHEHISTKWSVQDYRIAMHPRYLSWLDLMPSGISPQFSWRLRSPIEVFGFQKLRTDRPQILAHCSVWRLLSISLKNPRGGCALTSRIDGFPSLCMIQTWERELVVLISFLVSYISAPSVLRCNSPHHYF